MADSFSSTEFGNVLQDLQQDLEQQLAPALRESAQALETVLSGARERVREVNANLLQALQQAREMGEAMRTELEAFERVHTQASDASRETLEATQAPLGDTAAQTHAAQQALAETVARLASALPQFPEAVASAGGELSELVEQVAGGTREGLDAAADAATALTDALAAQADEAETALGELARACTELGTQAAQLTDRQGAATGEHLVRSAGELRAGVRDAATAAENAAGLVLEGLELFSGASDQMQSLFGDRSDEVMGTVRRIAELVEAIRPFIELAKSI
ncbi:MAG: hypothetical protein IT479_06795 [Xanthomonadales bacterium]|nr:hypothetical protein [Xanthomonadales bacterium]MCC6592968.1 hypothetical protein [Xanthomonadales bacterium]MCE7930608.1 hypothetical protein [Xanthomonadales bacterium PRO6]